MNKLDKFTLLLGLTTYLVAVLGAEAKSSHHEEKFSSVSEDDIDDLCGNYVLVRCPGSEKIICQIAVHGNVQKFRVKPPYIAGNATALRGEGNSSNSGYFVINTETNESKEGLPRSSGTRSLIELAGNRCNRQNRTMTDLCQENTGS